MASSSDEGEIVEDGGPRDMKATSLARNAGNGIDRQDRPRSRHSSADRDSDSRHGGFSRRSRSPRGFKRSRDDRGHGRPHHRDERHVRPRYDEPPRRDDYRRSRISYDDLDRPGARGEHDGDGRRERSRSRERGSDRDRWSDDRRRKYSRSPPARAGRFHESARHDRRPESLLSYEDTPRKSDTRDGGRSRVGKKVRLQAPDTETSDSVAAQGDRDPPRPEPAEDFEETPQVDEDAEIERRRKRREELLAKSSSATPLLLHAVGAAGGARGASPASGPADTDTPRTPRSDFASPRSPASPGNTPALNDNDLMNTHGNSKEVDEDGPSAADYDPTVDMKEDERRDEMRHGHTQHEPTTESTEQTKKAEDDDDFDMFAEDIDVDKYASKHGNAQDADEDPSKAGGILEGDDKDGYYKFRVGEILDGRYQIQTTLGRGMFSGVVRAVDVTTKESVAIKIMRNNDALRKGGYTEIAILQKLNDADPENRKHIVKFERYFDYKEHLCMAFENLSMNLREVLRKFGNNVGINLGATRTYAYQIFVALAHMRKCSIVHADLKPDNILVNDARNVLKICDLGTAIDRSDAATAHTEITPYLVSRFYRAPEIILGMPYDYGVDMWSIGCTLYEMFTGKILFAGDSNNQMLKAIMEIRGKITPKLFRRGQLSAAHFDEQGQFVSVERDKVLQKTAVRTLAVIKPTRDLRTRLTAASTGMNDVEAKHLNHFIDLLEQCLTLNPDKRITPSEALKHPFFISRSSATNGKR